MKDTGASTKKRLTTGQKMLVSEGFLASANNYADERIAALGTKKVSEDHEKALKHCVTLLEVIIGRSPSQLGLDEWWVMEQTRELVVLKRIIDHLTAKPKS
jgi:hypothetical protein